jgi:hypothetical protein
MSCTYTIDGNEVTEERLFDGINTVKGLLSIKTEDHKTLVDRTKEAAKDRFVNMDLFSPVQEQSYSNVIYSLVIDKLGVLTPNQEIRLSPDKVFDEIRQEFQNGSDKYNAIARYTGTPEMLELARTNDQFVAKFPEIMEFDSQQLKTLGEQYSNVADKANFDKFKEQVIVKLAQDGLEIVGKKLVEHGERQVSIDDKIQDENDQIDDTKREVNENFGDGQAWKTNPRNTASARVKWFLNGIPDTKKNVFNMRETVPPHKVFEKMMIIGSRMPEVNYESFQRELMADAEKIPYMKAVSVKLANIYKDGNHSFINDFLTTAQKAYVQTLTVKFEKGGDAGVSAEVINTNRGSIVNQVRTNWLENQKTSPIITKDNIGNYTVNKEVAQKLHDNLTTVNKGTLEEKKAFVKDFFKQLGVDFTDNMVRDLYTAAQAGDFKKYKAKTFDALFGPNGGFSNVTKKYLSEPLGKTESSYEDSNNAMKDERIFNDFAKIYAANKDDLQVASTRNGEGKSIYAYVNPSVLEDVRKKMSSGLDYYRKLALRSFSSMADFVKKKLSDSDFVFDVKYLDSLKEDAKGANAKVRKDMSDKEQLFDMIVKGQNQGGSTGYYNALTHSDKTTAPVIQITKYIVNKAKDIAYRNGSDVADSFMLKQSIKDELYKTALPEIRRMIDYANTPEKMNLANFEHAQSLFYIWPALNNSELYTGMKDIHAKIARGEELSGDDERYIKDIIGESFKSNVVSGFEKWKKAGVFKQNRDEKVEVTGYSFPLFDSKYTATKEVADNNGFEKAIHAIVDHKLNNLRAQTSYLQMLGADPALFYKGVKGEHGNVIKEAIKPKTGEDGVTVKGNIQDAPFASKFRTVQSTWADFSKRAAMFIAPGAKGVWEWKDSHGNAVDRKNYKAITLDTWKRDTPLFKGTDVTDAQELITVKEHIDRMMSEGRISDKLWQSITDKVDAAKGGNYTLSPEERKIIFQPTKPVQTGISDQGKFNRIDYVKSSTYVMIPEVVAGQEIDGLRRYMESKDIASANFDSAKKTGQPGTLVQAFDKDGRFVQPEDKVAEKATQNVSRDGLRTQQEIPKQKDEITNISQLNRNQLDGLLHVPDFKITDQSGQARKFSGQELKDLKENVRIRLFDIAQKEVIDRLGLTNDGGTFKFSDNKKLLDLLREEATKSGSYSTNDINSLKLDADGNFAFPLYLLASGEKFEGLLNSVMSSSIQLHNPGTALVQASAVGTKIDFSKLNDKQRSEILYTSRFDETKGLQYMRNENGVIKGAQVLVSQFIKGEDGKLIDLKQFAKLENGKYTIDDSKIPEKILQMIGARIPNQNHSSDLPIEVAGFLPDYMANTVIVPDGITSQMGSDFDVDKLYTYLSIMNFSKNADGGIDKINAVDYDLKAYDGTHDSLAHLDRDQLNELYKDIHWNVLTHPEGFKKIARSIDLPEVADELETLSFLNKSNTHWSPLDAEYQIEVFNDNKGGKTGVSIFAALGAFLADNQDKKLFVGENVESETGTIEQRKPIYIKSPDGSILDLSEISMTGSVDTAHGERTKSDNNNIAMNESVDNAKNKNMAVFNWHPRVLNALGGFIALSTPEGKIHDITFGTRLFLQDVIKKYIENIDNLSDSFNDQRNQNVPRMVTELLTNAYKGKLSDEALAGYESASKFRPEELALSAADLLDLLHTASDPEFADYEKIMEQEHLTDEDRSRYQAKMDNYNIKQLAVLDTFNRFDEVGKEIMKAGTAAYVYTKGIGASVFNVADKVRKLEAMAGSSVIGNLENLTGRIYKNGDTTMIEPKGEIGYSLQKSLFMARDIYKQIYPLHFDSAWYDQTVDGIFNMAAINKNDLSSDRFIRIHKDIFAGVKSYLFTNPTLEIATDMRAERERLLFDRGDNKSLSTRLKEAIKENPELEQNYFVQRLRTDTATIPGEPNKVTYNAPFSDDIDELANNKGFVSLILSGKPELIEIAKDLVKYSIVTGNQQNATSFTRFIPVEYFLMDKTFTDGLKKLVPDLKDNKEYIRQFVQNNPKYAFTLTKDQTSELIKPGNKGGFIIPREDNFMKQYGVAKLKTELSEDNKTATTKFPDMISYYDAASKGFMLYAKVDGVDGNTYERINTLGSKKSGVTEYAYGVSSLESSIASNRTPAQTLEFAMKNQDSVYHGLETKFRQNRVTDIAMGDVASQYIGSNPDNAKTIKNDTQSNEKLWGKKANTGVYASDDTVMVTGPKTDDNSDIANQRFTQEQLQEHFTKAYEPHLWEAVKAGAEILVGNRTGIDQITRDYLKGNDYREQRNELGFSTWSQKESVDMDDVDLDNDHAAIYEQYAMEQDNAEEGKKMADLLGMGSKPKVTEDDAADFVGQEPEQTDEQRNKLASMFDFGDNKPAAEGTDTNPMDISDEYDFDPDDLLEMDGPSVTGIAEDTEHFDLDKLGEIHETPVTVEDKDHEIVGDYIKDVNGNNNLHDVLNSIKTGTDNHFYQGLTDILTHSGAPAVNVIISDKIADPGMYHNGTIVVNPKLAMRDNPELSRRQNLENVIMHEAVHGYTADLLQKFEKDKAALNSKQLLFATTLKGLFNHALEHIQGDGLSEIDPTHQQNLDAVREKLNSNDPSLSSQEKSMYYGLTNIHEFASMIMTDNGFQQFMNSIPVDPVKNVSVMDKFKSLLFRLFQHLSDIVGLKPGEDGKSTVTYEAVNHIIGLVTSKEGNATEQEMQGDKFNPYKIVTPKGKFDVNEGQRAAIDKVAGFLNKPLGYTLEDNMFLLYGPGGTGKTASIMNAVLKAKEDAGKSQKVVFAAPTHTAKGELIRAGNEQAKTLHSVLGTEMKMVNGEEVFNLIPLHVYEETNKPEPDIFSLDTLVLDEASMIGTREREMIEQRLAERSGSFKLLFMGDYAQIPPVGDKPDADSFAIDLRKNAEKSVGLTVVERTKNRDITDLGAAYRRAIDTYNVGLENDVPSLKSGLHIHSIVPKEQLRSSENVRYHNNNGEFVDDFVNIFKQDPDNARNAVIIMYNNERHSDTTTLTGSIRRKLFGDAADKQLFLDGEPIFITNTIEAKPVGGGKPIEYGKNERMIIKNINETDKVYRVGKGKYQKNISVPVYEIRALDKDGTLVKYDALSRKFSDQITPANYVDGPKGKGYLLDDGSFMHYGDYKNLQDLGITSIYHGYLLSSHKVQGGTYDHPFVAEPNISKLAGMTKDGEPIMTAKQYAQTMYTAVSRASDKLYVLDKRSDGQEHGFTKPEFHKSAAKEESMDVLNLNKFTLENQCK